MLTSFFGNWWSFKDPFESMLVKLKTSSLFCFAFLGGGLGTGLCKFSNDIIFVADIFLIYLKQWPPLFSTPPSLHPVPSTTTIHLVRGTSQRYNSDAHSPTFRVWLPLKKRQTRVSNLLDISLKNKPHLSSSLKGFHSVLSSNWQKCEPKR